MAATYNVSAFNEFSSKFENLAINAPKVLKMYSKCSKYHFETVSVRNRG